VRVGIPRFIELMHAKLATTADVASWLGIVREVEPLFGPMPDFETTLLRKINQRAALCVRSGDPVIVLGGVLLGGGVPYGWIRWLAVRSSARGIGIGQCLVEEAVKRLATSNAISKLRGSKGNLLSAKHSCGGAASYPSKTSTSGRRPRPGNSRMRSHWPTEG
jgi:GNAT superfamily N-acetyltransferase